MGGDASITVYATLARQTSWLGEIALTCAYLGHESSKPNNDGFEMN